jgi:hypothetical protein
VSLASTFKDWCQHHGLGAKPACYIDETLDGLMYDEARIIRFVPKAERAAKHRSPQAYTVEMFDSSAELSYPLGAERLTKEQLIGAMVTDMMQESKYNE